MYSIQKADSYKHGWPQPKFKTEMSVIMEHLVLNIAKAASTFT